MKVIYISAPITCGTGKEEDIQQKYLDDAAKMAGIVWGSGNAAILPHACTRELIDAAPYDTFLEGDCELISRSDAIFVHIDWNKSPGCVKEVDYAIENRLPMWFYSPEATSTYVKPVEILLKEWGNSTRTDIVRSIDLIDKDFMNYLHTNCLPKFQEGSLEHGIGTWKKNTIDQIKKVFCKEEFVDLGFYYLFMSYLHHTGEVDEALNG